uniref:Uncharacterized protein n=1 Tax=Meloidogyne enterolobii TaxID=390850 RepID=A0A6V7UAZ8_MELEN|nr:unnamed protein product [Meloidogyne enterolobii]
MFKQIIFNIFLTIFILFVKKFKAKDAVKNGNTETDLDKEPYVLGNYGVNHYTIPYLIYDQCMPRPEQKKHLNFSLQFFLETLFICQPDGFLICYPSQLSKENKKNGTIFTVPYRLGSKKNKVTDFCENQRKEFCSDPKNKIICSPGNVAYCRWHGILVKTENKDGIVFVKILLSISNKIYKFEAVNNFSLELNQKNNFFTRLIIAGNESKEIQKKEENLQKEFLLNINKGAYLYKYIGLWALGMDLLPIRAQRYIHLFVYRGCSCALQARFTTPITAEIPFKNNLNTNQEKHCEKRFTNKKYKLGKVFEKAVFFYIMTDKRGIKEKMELNLLNLNASIIVEISSINVNWRTINVFYFKNTNYSMLEIIK